MVALSWLLEGLNTFVSSVKQVYIYWCMGQARESAGVILLAQDCQANNILANWPAEAKLAVHRPRPLAQVQDHLPVLGLVVAKHYSAEKQRRGRRKER